MGGFVKSAGNPRMGLGSGQGYPTRNSVVGTWRRSSAVWRRQKAGETRGEFARRRLDRRLQPTWKGASRMGNARGKQLGAYCRVHTTGRAFVLDENTRFAALPSHSWKHMFMGGLCWIMCCTTYNKFFPVQKHVSLIFWALFHGPKQSYRNYKLISESIQRYIRNK